MEYFLGELGEVNSIFRGAGGGGIVFRRGGEVEYSLAW